jgi:hypothetical protein
MHIARLFEMHTTKMLQLQQQFHGPHAEWSSRITTRELYDFSHVIQVGLIKWKQNSFIAEA